jgi:hypothetical protein
MVKKGMITFGALGDYRNAAVLCGSCQNQFDRTSNTGWVFLPTKMTWFIKWEEKDYKKRLDIFEKTEKIVERTYPDEQDYERYMRETGQLGDPDDGLIRGGLYYSYILEEMFPPVMMEALKERGMRVPGIMPGGPKRWHGAPMAAINRGFVVTGAPEMKLPSKEWEQLRTLQRLYSRKIPATQDQEPVSDDGSQDNTQSAQDQSVSRSRHGDYQFPPPTDLDQAQRRDQNVRRGDSRGDGAVESQSKTGRTLKRQRSNSIPLHGHEKRPCLYWDGSENECEDNSEVEGGHEESWCFGPHSTSDQKARLHGATLTAVC